MKVPYGYGFCRIRITYVNANGETGWENIDLKINNNTFPIDTEIGFNFINIYGNKVKEVTHVRRSFNVELINDDSTQTDIINLIAKLRKNPHIYFWFYLHCPTEGTQRDWSSWDSPGNQLCRYMCIADNESLQNLINGFQGAGQILSLRIDVKDKIAVNNFNYLYIPYRDTDTESWGSYPSFPSWLLATQSPHIGIITT